MDSEHSGAGVATRANKGLKDTVLVVVEGYSSYHRPIITHLQEHLSYHGMGNLCMTGRRLHPDTPDGNCSAIYRIMAGMDVAGVIVISSVFGKGISDLMMRDFLTRFSHLPMVTMGAVSDLCPGVMPDNVTPMRDLVEHMVRDPNTENVVFLRGIQGNPDAIEREQAFRDVLAERGLSVDESLVLNGNFRVADGFAEIDRLLQERQDIHAIVAANDAMACGAFTALRRHGLKVPEDVLLSGFDDSFNATSGDMALTTVRAAPEHQVERAADLLLEQIRTGRRRGVFGVRVPSEVILRSSSMRSDKIGDSCELKPESRAAAATRSSTAEYVEHLASHENVELAHTLLSNCFDRASVFRAFDEAMKAIGISRAFVLGYTAATDSTQESFRLTHVYPARESQADWASYACVKLLPDSLNAEFHEGTMVATSVHIEERMAGVLLYDPTGPARLSLEGVAQTLFGALHHGQQRLALQAQAQKLKRANSELVRLANYDSLTGLANRARLRTDLKRGVTNPDAAIAVLYFDLDGFKLVNDTLGHDAGDELLTIVASRVKACVRSTDVVSRLGGDEFSVLLRDIKDTSEAQTIAEQLLASIARPMKLTQQQTMSLSASIGIARFPDDGTDAETLLKHADTAMYQAKSEGRNRVVWFNSSMNHRVNERLRLDQAMREGLESGQFHLAFQPRMDLRRQTIIGVEALLRWTTAEGVNIPPSDFIPVAEQTGFIQQLDAFSFDTACAQARAWCDKGLECSVSVNISMARLQQTDIVEDVAATLARHGVPGGVMELEVTESVAMTELQRNVHKLEGFRRLGIQLSIDDFGTAYSSLSYLKHLPVDCLKIDRSFLSALESTEDELSPDGRIIRAVVDLGASLGLQVVAEGVENEVQHRFLKKLGCDGAQGFLFAKPLEPGEIDALLEASTLGGTERSWRAGT